MYSTSFAAYPRRFRGGWNGFSQSALLAVRRQATLPSTGNTNNVGFLADDLSLFCQVLIQ
jgi:hypothetical protein